MALCLKTWVPGQNLSRKMFKFIFQRILMLKKYFWIFIKIEKGARKDSSMQGCFENLNMQWEKLKS
jgi:hypothetical protein